VTPFDAAKYPIMAFEYRFSRDLKVDIGLDINDKCYVIKLTGADTPHPTLGRAADVVADGRWRNLCIDLRPMLKAALPKASRYIVRTVGIGDYGEDSTPRKTSFYIDNFMICGPGAPNATFKLRSSDITGIGGYSVLLDQSMNSTPKAAVTHRDGNYRSERLEPGLWYLHVKAVDNAGHWGQTSHYAYLVSGESK